MYPHSDAEAVRQAEVGKVVQSGQWRRSASVPVKRGANCESHLFCPFSTAEKFGAHSQPLPFSASKAAQQLLFIDFFFFLLHGAKLFRLHAALSGIAPTSPALCAYEHAFFISTASIFAASACYIAYLSLYGYIPSHWLSLQGLG